MDNLSLEELKTFMTKHSGWHVSLFMPTFKSGRETEQNIIRFKNLLQEAEKRLLAKGLRSPDVRKMLKPAQDLMHKPGFWQKQSHGLAVFLTTSTFHFYRLPLPFEELVMITHSFHLKPLLPLFASDGHFYILALSQNQIRLLEGTQHTVDEIDLESMPLSIAEILEFERFNRQLHFRTGTPSSRPGESTVVYHGHDPSDEDRNIILRWFRKIDDELQNVIVGRQSPIVLAGVEYLFPLYKEANSYPHLVEEGIPGNPEELRPEELHNKAWPLVQPIFMQIQEQAAAQYYNLSETGQSTTDVQEVVKAAYHGRVDHLFVALGMQVLGSFEQSTNTVHIDDGTGIGQEDLLDLAAIQTILKGGTVYAVEPEQVPDLGRLAAVFRY